MCVEGRISGARGAPSRDSQKPVLRKISRPGKKAPVIGENHRASPLLKKPYYRKGLFALEGRNPCMTPKTGKRLCPKNWIVLGIPVKKGKKSSSEEKEKDPKKTRHNTYEKESLCKEKKKDLSQGLSRRGRKSLGNSCYRGRTGEEISQYA